MSKFSRPSLIAAAVIVVLSGFGYAATTPPTAAAPVTTTPGTPVAKAASAKPPRLKVVRVDSEETSAEDGKGANAVDGDPATLWHTQYQDATPACPHEIVIQMDPPTAISGFTYLPRQDGMVNGTIKDYEFYVSDNGVDFGQPVTKGTFTNDSSLKTAVFTAKKCKYVKLRALSEVNAGPWTSAAEIGVVVAGAAEFTAAALKKFTLRFVRADSEETVAQDGQGANAVDGDPATIWHTQYQDVVAAYPHEIVIELDPPSAVKGLTYLPRQDDTDHGNIKEYEIYVSDDGKNWGRPVANGKFANNKDLKKVAFSPTRTRYVKLKALSEVNDEAWASAAEIGLVPAP